MLQHLFFSHHKIKLNATAFDLMATTFFIMQKNATVFFPPRRPTLGGNATFWHNFCYIQCLPSHTSPLWDCPTLLSQWPAAKCGALWEPLASKDKCTAPMPPPMEKTNRDVKWRGS